MMNKKILSVILSVFLVMTSVASLLVSADAPAFTDANISIEVTGYQIDVTVTSSVNGTMTAQLVNDENTVLYGIDSNSTPEEVTAGTYEYEFTFYMLNTVDTGRCRVYVGNNVPTTYRPFNYVKIDDLIDFYDGLASVEASAIPAYFETNASNVPVDLTDYEALCPEVLALVNAAIDAEDAAIATGILETDTVDLKDEKVEASGLAFKTVFADSMEVAKIANAAKKTDWATAEEGIAYYEEVVEDAILAGDFNNNFYTAEEGETPILDITDTYNAFKVETAAINTLDLADYASAFSKATLVQIANDKAFGIVKNAFLYFEGNGTITPDMTDIDELIANGNDADLWKGIKAATNSDCDTLVDNAERIAGDLNVPSDEEEEDPTPIDRPTRPSTTPIGGGSTPITPPKPSVTFTDLTEAEWARKPIEALAKDGIIEGIGDGKFAPNDEVSNEEYIKMIMGAFDLVEDDAKADFDDVANDRWSYIYLASAKELGIIDGTTINPDTDMSRADMAVVVYRVFKHLGIKVSGEAIEFTDTDGLSDEAKEAISALTGAGILNGMGDGTFAPNSSLTRAQAAKVIYYLRSLAK